jgi:enamine deaminase RidA (YjgF/YER057c/UK114 family)
MNKPIQFLNPEGVAAPLGMYSHVARVPAGELIFVAGQVAVDVQGTLVGRGDFAAQFHQVFQNLKAVLAGAGAGFTDVVKFTTYLVRPDDLAEFVRLRKELMPKLFGGAAYPPNTLVFIERLVREEFFLEIEAIARAHS